MHQKNPAVAVVVKYNKEEATVFPCRYSLDNNLNTLKRCAVCRMPLEEEAHKIKVLGTEAVFCCNDCNDHYITVLNQLKILWNGK